MLDIHIYGLLALTYFAFGVGMITYPKTAKHLVSNLEHEPIALYIGGVLALVIGYLLVVVRQGDWTGWSDAFLSCLGYAALIKGLLILMLPEVMIKYSRRLMKTQFEIQFLGLFITALGLICGLVALSL